MEQILPCQPYILRSLKDAGQEKMTEAGKNFFLKYLEAGLSMEDAYSFLLSLEQMSAIGTKQADFFIKDGDRISFDCYQEKILTDNKIKRIPCETLYKRVDKTLSACLFCPIKCPSCEHQLALEKSVAAFLFSSEENFMIFSSDIKELKLSIKDCFYSYVDLSDSLSLSKPYTAAALQLLVETLYENAPSFFHGICAGEMESIRQEFLLKLESEKRFPKELKEKQNVRSILYAKATSLLYATPLQKEDLKTALANMQKNRQNAEGNTADMDSVFVKEETKLDKNKKSGEILEQFFKEKPKKQNAAPELEKTQAKKKNLKEVPQKNTSTEKTVECKKEEIIVAQKQTTFQTQPDILPDEITLKELTDINFDLTHPEIFYPKEEPVKEKNREKNTQKITQIQTQTQNSKQVYLSVSERQNDSENFSITCQEQVENRNGRKQNNRNAAKEKEDPANTSDRKKEPANTLSYSAPTLFNLMNEMEEKRKPVSLRTSKEDTHADLEKQGMYVPSITSQVMETYTKPLSKKDTFYFLNLAGKTGNLFLEVFFEPGGIPVLVLYDAAGDTFFHVKNPLDYEGIILQMLCHKSIRKICVNPYTIYGYAYTFSHFAKNVFSLERHNLSDALFHTERIKSLPASLSLMKNYPSCLQQEPEVTDSRKDTNYERTLLLDAAYGCSLMTNRFFKERLFLFKRGKDGQLQFYLPKKLTPDKKGTFLRYHLSHNSDFEAALLFDDLLTFVCERGCFKNIPFQIVYRDNSSLLFFIEEDFKKRFDTICTIHLTELCETYSLSQTLLQVDMEQTYEEAIKAVTT